MIHARTSMALGLAAGLVVLAACSVTVTTSREPSPATVPDGSAASSAGAPAEPSASASSASTTTAPPEAKQCTQMACRDALSIAMDWGKGALEPGKHTILVEADGKKGSCEIELPTVDCTSWKEASCSGDLGLSLDKSCIPSAPGKSAGAVGPLRVDGAPKKVSVEVLRGKTKLARTELTPTYAANQPNGPACPPTCQQGGAEMCVGTCAKGMDTRR